ncbi:amino acid adenylation domain-containing protein [Priestia filamentosa]|uniref:amino acid adenylation domain-containing protein n=1 Tax=Priestia filamentosa TaxID=1402861 RepID=UPI00397A2233
MKKSEKTRWALSGAQSGIWFAQQLDPKDPIYNTGEYIDLNGDIDVTKLQEAIKIAVSEADALHVSYSEDENGPFQLLDDSKPMNVHYIDLSHEENAEEKAKKWMREDLAKPISLEKDPLFLQAVFKIESKRFFWYQRIHHIAMDAFGFSLITKRVASLYTSLLKGEKEAGTFSPFTNVLEEDVAYHQSNKFRDDESFWMNYFEDNPDVVSLGEEVSNPSSDIVQHTVYLPSNIVREVKSSSVSSRNWHETITAALAVYIHRLTSTRDVVLCLPMMNRLGSAALNVPTMALNLLPLRLQITSSMNFLDVIEAVSSEMRKIRPHRRYRHEELRRKLGKVGGNERIFGPQINIMPFQYALNFGGYKATTHKLATGPVDDITFNVYDQEDENGLRIDVEGNASIYTKEDIALHSERFLQLLQTFMKSQTSLTVGKVPLLLEKEQAQLAEYNDTTVKLPPQTLVELFEQSVKQYEGRTAFSDSSVSLTYKEVNEKVNRLSRLLREHGVKSEDFIGIMMDRSVDMAISMLAVLKAGAAYVPIDPEYPAERISYVLQDAKPSLVLTDEKSVPSLDDQTVDRFVLDEEHVQYKLASYEVTQEETVFVSEESPAYMIYTSGSTGNPKGVVISRKSLVNFLHAMQHDVSMKKEDKLLAVTTISFDISALELYLPFLSGAQCVIAKKEEVQDQAQLASLLQKEAVTVMQATPTLWRALLSYSREAVRELRVLVGGEALPGDLLGHFRELDCEVTNFYGPTETTIWSSSVTFSKDGNETPNIGTPILNTTMYVLDSALQPVPYGTLGELYIGGEGLAHGYFNKPSLTSERFIANPFEPGTRMYRTGDIVRFSKNGSLEYVSRADHQIKMRGFRIELGEIENVISAYETVSHSTVIVRKTDAGSDQLVAYIVPLEGEEVDTRALRQYVSEQLPEYMVPAIFMTMDKLPQTPNGKIDRKALPEPDISVLEGRAPRTPQEEMLRDLFIDVLGVTSVGIDDDFFHLGGHSLLASVLLMRIRKTFGVEISLRALFDHRTVAELAVLLEEGKAARPPIQKVNYSGEVPLSFAQQRLWFLHYLEGWSPTYNIPVVSKIKGELDVTSLKSAIGDVVERHAPLRTLYKEREGVPYQEIREERLLPLTVKEVEECELDEQLQEAIRYSFRLSEEPPFHAYLFSLNKQEHVLLLLFHHISCDGWSLAPVMKDLAFAYNARCQQETPSFTPLPVQYKDYTLWQKSFLEGDRIEEQLSFWKKELAQLPEELELPTDYPRPVQSSYQGGTVPFSVESKLHQKLSAIAKENGTSLFMVLQAGLSALFTRLGGGEDIAIGSPVAGRNDDALTELVGLFINTLVLRTDTSGNPTFRELLGRVRKVNLDAYEHSDIPFERLVEELNPTRSRSKHPLFQVMLALQNTAEPSLALKGTEAEVEMPNVGASKFDLTIELREQYDKNGSEQGIHGFLEYSKDLFTEESAVKMVERWCKLLEEAVDHQDEHISFLDILTEEEKTKLVKQPSITTQEGLATIAQLFEEKARVYRDNIALVFKEDYLTYGELNERANRLSRSLIEKGVGPEDFIALSLPRSVEMIVSILAVLKTGAAYVPLDPTYPSDRLEFILQDTKPSGLLALSNSTITIPAEDGFTLYLDREDVSSYSSYNVKDEERLSSLERNHPAYVIYTSGSTGKPKGVVIPHHNVIRLLDSTEEWFHFDEHDTWTMFHSYAFDFSVWEIWGALLRGGRLVIVPHTVSRSPKEFLQLLVREGVTVLNQTPSAFYQFMREERENENLREELKLRFIIFGGEALDLSRLEEWYSRHEENRPTLINMYGITETTVHVSFLELGLESISHHGNSLIGENIKDLGIYVLDDYLRPVAPGVIGEMYVSGEGLARGYLNHPGLTAERFVANPYGKEGSRMYRTGDKARYRHDGTLDYIGRADHQVKIRGFRIELGEIQSVLLQSEFVESAAVVVGGEEISTQKLIAYYIPTSNGEGKEEEIRTHVRNHLPDYMIPTAFIEMEEFPLTVNGKLDVKKLPLPDFNYKGEGDYPRTPKEELLCDIFTRVLQLERVGIHDNFFNLGGHSLLAVELISKIRDALGVELNIGHLFEAPTVSGLARQIDEGGEENSLNVLLPLRKSGQRNPVFCVHPAGGLSWCYAGLMTALSADYPIYGLQARGISEDNAFPRTLDEMAEDYVNEIRTVQPHGPYHLIGWSLGGNVVHAMATRLQREGEEVRLLALLDAYPSHFLPLKGGPDEEEALIALLALGGYDPDHFGENEPLTMESAINILKKDGSALASLSDETIVRLKETYRNSVRILGEYKPQSFKGNLMFFRSTIIPEWFDPISPDAWKTYLDGEIEQYDIDCRHKDMCQPKPLAEIGELLAQALERIENEGEKTHVKSI